uniref:Leucine rich immune protein (Coil-less) n=1 Tax=Anopheles christyi TaxID=43041 RepID=A0A182KGJ1_9DIPT
MDEYEFFCEYSACIVSNIHITYDGLYAFTFIPNGTDMLFLKAAKGRLADFSFVEAIPDLVQFVLEKCKFEELVLPAFRKSSSVVMKHVSVKTIRFHSADKMLHDFRLCGTTFNDIPYTVLQLQYVLNLEQSRSSIRQLHLSVLRNLKRLVNLNLSYNKIQTVTADPESLCCNQLQSLNLIGNSLMRFDFGILMYMPQFQRIFLGDNKIDTITTGQESRYTSRKHFCSWKSYYLKRMEVDFEIPKPPCVDYFAKLNRITLNRNKLTVIDTSLLEYMNLLNDLDLAHNPIKTVKINKDKVPILLNLSLLNGEAGYLHTLPPDVFTSD